MVAAKQPRFVVSEDFEFDRFGVRPDFALAQSLFTHLSSASISRCLTKLHGVLAGNGVLYATFNECAREQVNPSESHDHRVFHYTRSQMRSFAESAGWQIKYIGDWGHPRGQKMLELRPSNFSEATPSPVSAYADQDDRPNLLLLGVGHSGTSVTAKLLGTLGWNLGEVDGFSENVVIRRRNAELLSGKRPDLQNLAQSFADLRSPWLVKDPRFVLTLDQWLPVFQALPAAERPTLLHLTRDIQKVQRTYLAYGEVVEGAPGMYRHTVQELSEIALRAYGTWPFAKLHLEFEQIVAAAKAFNIGRAQRRDTE
ncbi:MAG: hypothetical protein SGJ19_20150 [Planctomycetia bacterium]|nr:hypothetical protein [Planctomycetia bacterium]